MAQGVISELNQFDKEKLQHVDTVEKVVLPNKDVILKEKGQMVIDEIPTKRELKHIEVQEKNPLPTKEDIAAEKGSQ